MAQHPFSPLPIYSFLSSPLPSCLCSPSPLLPPPPPPPPLSHAPSSLSCFHSWYFCLSVDLSVWLSVLTSVRPSACLSVSLSVCLPLLWTPIPLVPSFKFEAWVTWSFAHHLSGQRATVLYIWQEIQRLYNHLCLSLCLHGQWREPGVLVLFFSCFFVLFWFWFLLLFVCLFVFVLLFVFWLLNIPLIC